MTHKIQMFAKYKILMDHDSPIDYPATGGFAFQIGDANIPFDFDASADSIDDDIVTFESGYGPFFNEFQISEDFRKEIEAEGVDFDEITAEFLASVKNIKEFYVNFEMDNKEYGAGENVANNPFRIHIFSISFLDLDTNEEYFVSDEVIDIFNKGE